MDIFPRDPGENKKYLKPPPSKLLFYLGHDCILGWFPRGNAPLKINSLNLKRNGFGIDDFPRSSRKSVHIFSGDFYVSEL